jgi:hypothetical protein
MENTTHELKTIEPYFLQLHLGVKDFELRKFDRDYKVGDTLILKQYNAVKRTFTGQSVIREIKYILTDATQFGLMDGYCILGLKLKRD